MTHDERNVLDAHGCRTCLGFGYLPEIGPCPDCDPDGYAEHVAEFVAAMTGEAYGRLDIVWDSTDAADGRWAEGEAA